MRRVAIAAIVGLVDLLSAASVSAWQDDKASDAKMLAEDLAKLQGTWELERRVGNKTLRSVKVIEGNKTRLQRFDEDGQIYWAHTSEFRLARLGRVRMFTFFNLEVTAGSSKGRKSEKPSSFIYTVTDETLVEARGLLVDKEDEEPQLTVWRRVKNKDAANSEQPQRPAVLDQLR